jgi:hypothetical protein
MATRQVIPKEHFDTGGITTLRIVGMEPSETMVSNGEHIVRDDRAVSLNWDPTRELAARLGTVTLGDIEKSSVTTPAKPSSFKTISTHRIERRVTSARMSRVLATVLPLAALAVWFWYRFGWAIN